MRKMREIAKICLIVENTGLDPLCRAAGLGDGQSQREGQE